MLKTAAGFNQPSYKRSQIQAFGGLNTDANESTLPVGDLTDCFNLRMQRPGELEIRSGYHKHDNAINGFVLCKCEYRSFGVLFDVTVYQDRGTGDVKVQLINRSSLDGSTDFLVSLSTVVLDNVICTVPLTNVDSSVAQPPIAAAIQYANFIVITVYDIGTFVVFPKEGTASPNIGDKNKWNSMSLGKGLCPTPYEIEFKDKQQGDLWVILDDPNEAQEFSNLVNTNDPRFVNHFAPITVAGQTELPYQYTKIPAQITYYASNFQGPGPQDNFDAFKAKFFEFSTNDPGPDKNSTYQPRDFHHMQTRGWGYRFAFKRKLFDGRGGTAIFTSYASSDVWVPDIYYLPPQLTVTRGNSPYPGGSPGPLVIKDDEMRPIEIRGAEYSHFTGPLPNRAVKCFTFITYPDTNKNPTIGDRLIVAKPNGDAMADMAKRLIAYANKPYTVTVPTTTFTYPGTPNIQTKEADWIPGFYFVLWYTGYREVLRDVVPPASFGTFDYEVDYNPNGQAPYATELRAHDLADAPLAIWRWKFFATTDGLTPNPTFPSDVVEIEVYRTAWSSSTEVFGNNADPLFQPHFYGYVGSIKPDKDFIDDVKDVAIDFGQQPTLQDAYLEGQFSGQVIREYNRKLVIGNVSTNYWVNAPARWMPTFITSYSDWLKGKCFATLRPGSPTTKLSGSLNDTVKIFIAYVDKDGNQSDAVQYWVDPPLVGTYSDIFLQIPQGYMPAITAVRVFVMRDGVTFKLSDVSVTNDFAGFTVDDINAAATIGDFTKTTKNTKEPGAVIWSKANQLFFFPPTNIEVINKTAGVTFMESIIGPLWVWTDRSLDLSTINEVKPRGEEENQHVGCIGRWAACKVDKVVFFLSASGLYIAASDGIIPFPAKVQNAILPYLREEISGQPELLNARRASIGWNNKRNELWLYFPSSRTITTTPGQTGNNGSLPDKLLIFRFFDETYSKFANYEFELVPNGNGLSIGNGVPVVFQSHTDGSLYCSYTTFDNHDPINITGITTLDNDTIKAATVNLTGTVTDIGDWDGQTAFDVPISINAPMILKRLRQVITYGDFDCQMSFMTGAANGQGRQARAAYPDRSIVNTLANIYPVTIPPSGVNIPIPHRVPPRTVESTASAPYVRLTTNGYLPPLSSEIKHVARFKGLDIFWTDIRNHPQ